MTALRISIRVKPGARKTAVGGEYGEGELVVAVGARPVDGAANTAVLAAVAAAFGLRKAAVRLVSGHTARTKVLELDGDPDQLRARLVELLQF